MNLDTIQKAQEAVSNSSALLIAIGVLTIAAFGLMAFYRWINKISSDNRDSLEEIVNRRVKIFTAPLEERVEELEKEVRNLYDNRKISSKYMAQALNASDLQSCKGLIVQAMESIN